MVTRELFEGMVVKDSIYAPSVDPLVITTVLKFIRYGTEMGFATLYDNGKLYCNEKYLPLAIEWITNNYKHKKWEWWNR
jgi:hypothetical protein